MIWSGFFCYLWKWYALERKFRADNGGLKNGTYPICTHMKVPPPPGGGGGGGRTHITARNRTHFRQGSRARLRAPGCSRVILMLSRAIWALFFKHSDFFFFFNGKKHIVDPILGRGRLLRPPGSATYLGATSIDHKLDTMDVQSFFNSWGCLVEGSLY